MRGLTLSAALIGLVLSASRSPGQEKAALDPAAFKRWGQSEMIVLAELVRATAGPVGLSEPPLYTTKLEFVVQESLRGAYPKGTALAASHSVKQKDAPVFPLGKCLVGLSANKGMLRVDAFVPADDKEVAQARLVASIPLGWGLDGAQVVSPWAGLGKKGWAAGVDKEAAVFCKSTGRPALLAGHGVVLGSAKVPPKVELKFKNPDGDGEYTITVRNNTDKDLAIPALLSDGKNILWNESLVVICQGKAYAIPGARGVPEGARAAVLKPNEEVSTVVNALKLEGPEWPRGGYRIEFRFCLGEKAVTESFYYFSTHHDPIREKLLGK